MKKIIIATLVITSIVLSTFNVFASEKNDNLETIVTTSAVNNKSNNDASLNVFITGEAANSIYNNLTKTSNVKINEISNARYGKNIICTKYESKTVIYSCRINISNTGVISNTLGF